MSTSVHFLRIDSLCSAGDRSWTWAKRKQQFLKSVDEEGKATSMSSMD